MPNSFGGNLKKSTVANLLLGPMVDRTDGNVIEESLLIAPRNVHLVKNGLFTGALKDEASNATHLGYGVYSIAVNATDTNTAGRLSVIVNDDATDAQPFHAEYFVDATDSYMWATSNNHDWSMKPQEINISGSGDAISLIGNRGITISSLNEAIMVGSLLGEGVSISSATHEALTLVSGSTTDPAVTIRAAAGAIKIDATNGQAVAITSLSDEGLSVTAGGSRPAAIFNKGPGAPTYDIEGVQDSVNVSTLSAYAATQVGGQVNAQLNTAIAEPAVGVPTATGSVRYILSWLWAAFRNKGSMSKTSGNKTFHNSSDTPLAKKVATDDGTTYTEDEMSSI